LERQIAIPRATSPVVPTPRHAGFWIRSVAGIIDLIVLAIPFAVFVSFLSVAMGISTAFLDLHPGMPPSEILARFGPRFIFISFAFFAVEGWFYFAILESSAWHATLGKHLLGLYIADVRGNPVGFWRASSRFVCGRLLIHVPILGVYYFLVDCLCVALAPSKRAIHDVLAGCLVLRESVDHVVVR
jgi:uncharacterized RDD family membrane protein YckC